MMSVLSYFLLSLFMNVHPAVNHQTLIPATGYKIKAKVAGLADSTCYLGHYYGQYQTIIDTTQANATGEIVFSGSEALKGGIYFIVLPGKQFFEFIVNKEQEMYFETDMTSLVKSMKIKGSSENKLFYDYLNYINENQEKYMALKNKATELKDNKDSTEVLHREMEAIDQKVKDYKMKLMQDNPESFVSTIFLASKDPEIPEAPVLPNGRKDSTFTYRYFKDHYWDNIDLSDDRILRTPVFYNKLNYFFSNVVIQIPDSIIKEADILAEKAKANKEIFKYVVWYITYTYETSKIMGFDAIFVHMVEKYYMTGQCYWVSEITLENMVKRIEKIKPTLLGAPAPNMIMQDTSLQLQSLYAINAKYTIIVFWDYECGHCKTEIPRVVELYNEKKESLGIEVFAVCTDTNMAEMKSFIIKNQMNFINVNGPRSITPHYSETYDIYSTPVVFILDEQKTIIAKRIDIEQAEDIIKHDMKVKAMKKD